jgi:galactose mutarotase-like enzyme
MLTLEDESAKSRVEIVPERGGLVTRFVVDGRPVLYLDDATLADPKKNVRGGVPVLFPSPGKLTNDRWSRDGRSGTLPQHGFARNLAWKVSSADREIVLQLGSDSVPRETWPWSFVLEHRFSLAGRTLRIDQKVTNTGDGSMAFGLGFHPYFHVESSRKANVTVGTQACRAWDNTTKEVFELTRIELGKGEVDLHLLDHGRSDCALFFDGDPLVRIECSPEYQTWVIWTLPDRDFVCLEPWTCPFDALNTGQGLIHLAPGESRELFVAMTG